MYGDKCDPLIQECILGYRGGAEKHGYWESEEVYRIAVLIKEKLDLLDSASGRKKFHQILKKYSPNPEMPSESMEIFLSRKENYYEHYPANHLDVNADYRLFDFEDKVTGERRMGTVSRINAMKPHLVVSLHLTPGAPSRYGGMAAVITPGYDTFSQAISFVNGNPVQRKKIRNAFLGSPWQNWMRSAGKDGFQSFMTDSWIYLVGRSMQSSGLEPDMRPSKYRGYRQNWVTWVYADDESWIDAALSPEKGSAYYPHIRHFKPIGSFWEREKSIPERWRREGGQEGYGGDNYYSGKEIMRYIRKGFLANSVDTYTQLPVIAKPYISTWVVPTYINAVSAYLEIAHLDAARDVQRILRHKEIYAESIAVGIYSLFYSLPQPATNRRKDLPTGTPLDFRKYVEYEGGNHFLSVVR